MVDIYIYIKGSNKFYNIGQFNSTPTVFLFYIIGSMTLLQVATLMVDFGLHFWIEIFGFFIRWICCSILLIVTNSTSLVNIFYVVGRIYTNGNCLYISWNLHYWFYSTLTTLIGTAKPRFLVDIPGWAKNQHANMMLLNNTCILKIKRDIVISLKHHL